MKAIKDFYIEVTNDFKPWFRPIIGTLALVGTLIWIPIMLVVFTLDKVGVFDLIEWCLEYTKSLIKDKE